MSTNFPDSPFTGQVFVVDRKKYLWDGNAWRSTAFTAGTMYQPVPPSTGQNNGDLWINSNANKLNVFDENTGVWEKIYPNILVNNGEPLEILAPVAYPVMGDLYYDSNDLDLKIYDGSDWQSSNQSPSEFNSTKTIINTAPGNVTIDIFDSHKVMGVKWIMSVEDTTDQKSCTIEILANNKMNTEILYNAVKAGNNINFTFDVIVLSNSIRLRIKNDSGNLLTVSTIRYETTKI